jgi:hypothetical protein
MSYRNLRLRLGNSSAQMTCDPIAPASEFVALTAPCEVPQKTLAVLATLVKASIPRRGAPPPPEAAPQRELGGAAPKVGRPRRRGLETADSRIGAAFL